MKLVVPNQKQESPKRDFRPLIIAGNASGVGKTTVALGVMGACKRRGLRVAPFKVGPDYIDPGYHWLAAGMPSRNLDTWLTPPSQVQEIYQRGVRGRDISIVEGVMGLFDGCAGAQGQSGSTAEISRLLKGAVVLVVDSSRLARSLAPLLQGFAAFDPRLELAGCILNNVGSESHARILKAAAREVGVPVLGILPRRGDILLSSRHLGLVPAAEKESIAEKIELIIDHIEENVDVKALLATAAAVPLTKCRNVTCRDAVGDAGEDAVGSRLNAGNVPGETPDKNSAAAGVGAARVRLAVARDEAFSFYYVDSLEALYQAGAQLIYFSPLRDQELPACDGLYLGGGFPEMFAAQLESNTSMRSSIAAAAAAGLPIYAECGGLLYLCQSLESDGKQRQMAAALPLKARMTPRRQALGYVEATVRKDSILMASGEKIRGHRFHWSMVEWLSDYLAYDCFSSRGEMVAPDGFCRHNLLASYVHIHFAGYPDAAAEFVATCAGAKGVNTSASV